MIPVLYASNETTFTHNGIGLLTDIISCEVTEERNGAFELVFSYPLGGAWYAFIGEELIVKAKANEVASPQLFRIYKTSKPINGIVTYYAEHISYLLNGNPVTSFTISSGNAGRAIQTLLDNATFEHNFIGWSDIATLNSTNKTEPSSIRSLLGGTSGSVLDVWGGEYEFDNFNIKLHAHRGTATDVVIEYGKNLTDVKQESNIESVYTAMFPYARYTTKEEDNGVETEIEHIITLEEKVLNAPSTTTYAHSKAKVIDLTDQFESDEAITETMLRTAATSYLSRNPIDEPNINITASFVQLWQTDEYKNIAPLERVKLCDTVTVKFTKLGVNATAKVIKTVYDSINERYLSVELGNAKSSFSDTVSKNETTINNVINTVKKGSVETTKAITEAIKTATNLITGNSGGYVVLYPAENPSEILILDTPDIETAVNVWRWNSSGLGYSNTGYNGEFGLAMTMDGAINADYITAGIIKGDLIEANSVKAAAISTLYKNEVTNEITGATSVVEQAFVAADEQLKSQLTQVTDVLYGDVDVLTTQISDLQQTVENLNLSFSQQYTGGINNILNSSGLNGVSNDWGYTGTVTTMQNAEAKSNTLSASMFCVQPGTLTQELTLIAGVVYNLTFKARKNSSHSWVKIICGGNEHIVFDEQLATEWQEYSFKFTSTNQAATLVVGSYNGYVYIADIMLTEGNAKVKWCPAPNEIYTTDVKIDRTGINITNSESETSTNINNIEFAVKHKSEKVITVNKDLTILKKSKITDEMTVGKLLFSPVTDGVDMILLD